MTAISSKSGASKNFFNTLEKESLPLKMQIIVKALQAFSQDQEKDRARLASLSRNYRRVFSGLALKIILGDKIVKEKMAACLKSLGLPQNQALFVAELEKFPYVRDACLRLLDGTYLFPSPLEGSEEPYYALLPKSMHHFIKYDFNIRGTGLCPKLRQCVLDFFIKHNIPHKISACAIEGGNCHIFTVFNGSFYEPRAIIGLTSLFFSMGMLQNRRFFSGKKEYPIDPHSPVADEYLLMARNSDLCIQYLKKPKEKKEPSDIYRKSLVQPLTSQERSQYIRRAKEFERMILMTKQYIAEELKIPLKCLAVVNHFKFHIDMEISILNGRVLVHDDRLTISMLSSLQPEGEVWDDISAYKEGAEERLTTFNCDEQIRLIKGIGCDVVPISGIYETSNIAYRKMNFMNGVMATRNIFITNSAGPGCKEYEDFFVKQLHTSGSAPIVGFVEDMDKDLTEYNGGIHCQTLEVPDFKSQN